MKKRIAKKEYERLRAVGIVPEEKPKTKEEEEIEKLLAIGKRYGKRKNKKTG